MSSSSSSSSNEIVYRPYAGESDLQHIMSLVQSELSEPYVIYTFRYFLHQWPHLSFLACSTKGEAAGVPSQVTEQPVGVIVCKQSTHRDLANRGYIAMLSVRKEWRNRGIASTLVRNAITTMKEDGADEIVLETEYDNHAALSLYESLGFIREKRLYRFYLNGKDAFRLVLVLPPPQSDDGSDEGMVMMPSGAGAGAAGVSVSVSGMMGSGRPRGLGMGLGMGRHPRRYPLYRAIQVSPYSDEEDNDN